MSRVAAEPPRSDSIRTSPSLSQLPVRPIEQESEATHSSVTGLERRLCRRLLSAVGAPPVEMVLWDGSTVSADAGAIESRISIRDRQTFWRLLANPLYQFGEAYTAGAVTVDGDLADLLTVLYRSLRRAPARRSLVSRFGRLLRRFAGASLAGSRRNIHHHYDIGNDFYRIWLDDQLIYTCAYFPEASCTLEQAQVAKMDHVCRKLQLQPGETVVEAGCGWGALALHMAQHYGVSVKAYNISEAQIEYARERVRHLGLEGRVEFILDDWREISGRYDVFVSIGMLEHVGLRNYGSLGSVINRCLRPFGRGLIHSIARDQPARVNAWISRRVFPGSYAPTLAEMTKVLQPYDFSVLDVENLRLHYAETLRHWLQRFEDSRDSVRQMFDDRFVRLWRFYLTGSMAAFEAGALQLYQIVFNRAQINQIPRTRRHMYAESKRAVSMFAPAARHGRKE